MKTTLKQALRSGLTFGIIHIFFVLIGFNALVGILFARLTGVKQPGDIPAPLYLAAYTLLLGIWAGVTACAKKREFSFKQKLRVSASAGVSAGVTAAVFNLFLLVILSNDANVRNVFSVLSASFIKGTLFSLPPLAGLLLTSLLLVMGSLLGGALAGLWHKRIFHRAGGRLRKVLLPLVSRLRAWTSGKFHLVWQVGVLALLAVVVVLLPLKWGSYWNYVLGTVFLYVILGLGLNIVVGLSGQLVLGFIAFFAIGAYSMALLNAPLPYNLLLGFWPSLLLGVVFAALAGLLLGLPLMRLRGDYLAIVTLGFGEIIRILLKSDALTQYTGGPRGIQDIGGPTLFSRPFVSDVDFIYLIIAAMLLAMFVYRRLQHSRTGRAWMAIREDETVARASGVNTVKYKLLALVIGAAFAGLAGAIFASRNQFTGPEEHSLMASINVLSLIIVGGMGSIPGTLVGAFALKGLPEILREFENYRLLAFGALLVAMMLSKPDGLLPSRRPTYTLPEEGTTAEEQEVGNDG